MAETVTVIRIDTAEVKEMIAEKYNVPVESIKFWNGVPVESIKFWNGRFEFDTRLLYIY
ncbi:MAG: hypothetical protein VZR53_16770 [Prevotella sp.]|nr:hypothetical protein [Prevotella sp.]